MSSMGDGACCPTCRWSVLSSLWAANVHCCGRVKTGVSTHRLTADCFTRPFSCSVSAALPARPRADMMEMW